MSDNAVLPVSGSPAESALDAMRKHAKRQLKRARGGDPALLAELRRILPRLAALNDSETAAQLKLADIQHALAREHGLANWAALKQQLAALDPLHMQAQRFLEAVRNDDAERVGELCARHPALAEYSIHTAAALGSAGEVERLLREDPALTVAAHPGGGWTALLYACAGPAAASYSSPDTNGDKAVGDLEVAATGDHAAVVRLLLGAGADPDSYILWMADDPASKLSALYYACITDKADAAALLLERGADPNDGESLYHAAELNRRDCLELLVAHGAELSARHPRWDNTVLYFLCGYFENHSNAASCVEGMRWLLEHGADPNVTSYAMAATPLHRVAEFGHGPEVAQLLLDHGAALDAPRSDGRTPYCMAVRSGNTRMVEWLAARGADTLRITPADRLLGHALNGDEAAVQALLAEQPGLVDTLTDEDRQVFSNAAWLGRNNALRLLARAGLDPAFEGGASGTALHAAAWHGNVEAVRILLELGAPVNIRDKTYGSSPLAWAAHGSRNCRKGADDDYCAVIELLLEAGADRETAVNRWGEAPELLGSRAVVKLLKERGSG